MDIFSTPILGGTDPPAHLSVAPLVIINDAPLSSEMVQNCFCMTWLRCFIIPSQVRLTPQMPQNALKVHSQNWYSRPVQDGDPILKLLQGVSRPEIQLYPWNATFLKSHATFDTFSKEFAITSSICYRPRSRGDNTFVRLSVRQRSHG